MTNPICRDCGKECVWGKTKAGRPILMDLRPHFIGCTKRHINGKSGSSPARSGALEDAVTALRSLGYLKREALAMLDGVAPGEASDMVLAALKGKE
jgi:Holliday junction resolvasome RuvABC DNA-binding subunit